MGVGACIALAIGFAACGVTSTDPDPHEQAAKRVAESMIARFTPPQGSRPVDEIPQIHRDETDPGPLRQQVVRVARWHVSGTAMQRAEEIASSPPLGFGAGQDAPMKLGNGNVSVWLTPVDRDSSASQHLTAEGVRERSYEVVLADVGNDTVAIWVEVTVRWVPTRSAASMIPDDATTLVITHTPPDQLPGSVTEPSRTVHDRVTIDRIAGMLDRLDEGPDSDAAIDCTAHPDTAFGSFDLVFATADDARAATAEVDTMGCAFVKITVNGEDKGGFWGTAALGRALHDLVTP